MKSTRIALVVLLAVTTFTTTAAFAQADAKKTFDQIKSLDGNWQGKAMGKDLKVTFRTTAGGSAVISEITAPETMVTMFHEDNDRVLATHYCAAGNQPRMQASTSPDGKTITFTFVDATNLATPKTGHMTSLVLTIPDSDHHIEDWTFTKEDGQLMKEHFDLTRAHGSL